MALLGITLVVTLCDGPKLTVACCLSLEPEALPGFILQNLGGGVAISPWFMHFVFFGDGATRALPRFTIYAAWRETTMACAAPGPTGATWCGQGRLCSNSGSRALKSFFPPGPCVSL